MMYGSILSMRSAIAPPDYRDRALASSGVKPIDGLAEWMMGCIADAISVLWVIFHFPTCLIVDIGVFLVDPCRQV